MDMLNDTGYRRDAMEMKKFGIWSTDDYKLSIFASSHENDCFTGDSASQEKVGVGRGGTREEMEGNWPSQGGLESPDEITRKSLQVVMKMTFFSGNSASQAGVGV